MDNFQVLLANIFIVALWCIISLFPKPKPAGSIAHGGQTKEALPQIEQRVEKLVEKVMTAAKEHV